MNFDYINDLFGKFRKGRKTKFTDVENREKKLLKEVYDRKITYDEFFDRYNAVMNEFIELMDHTVDQDTPLWMNEFGAMVFLRRRDWHVLRKTHDEHPEKFNTPQLEAQFRRIETKDYDEWLREKIGYCLNNF